MTDKTSRRMFRSLQTFNFKVYCAGQSVSLVGGWMQGVAQSWLVLDLTGSSFALGLVVAAQFLPLLLAGPYGGLIADRSDKIRLLKVTQSALALLALMSGILTAAGAMRLWILVLLALALGAVNAVDMPTRQTFLPELVGVEMLREAISINSMMMNAARAVGPALAGILIASFGVESCFMANAASFIPILMALRFLRTDQLQPALKAGKASGQLLAGLRYVRETGALALPLAMMALIGTLAYEFQVVFPALAQAGFHGGARTYGFMTSAVGAGAVCGGLYSATRGRAGIIPLAKAAAMFSVTLTAVATISSLFVELIALFFVGVSSTMFLTIGSSTLQIVADPTFRGRVMGLWTVAFSGSTCVGGPVIGYVVQYFGARQGVGVGAIACLIAVILGWISLPRIIEEHRFLERRTSERAS
ncbi:MFS transporter [Streptomyces sp. NPDC048191]|uniref:MFS transporter n=1 Tax=Streptomyces sp. NPDC048191 TaxID=3155484 RepID=UPI00340B676C